MTISGRATAGRSPACWARPAASSTMRAMWCLIRASWSPRSRGSRLLEGELAATGEVEQLIDGAAGLVDHVWRIAHAPAMLQELVLVDDAGPALCWNDDIEVEIDITDMLAVELGRRGDVAVPVLQPAGLGPVAAHDVVPAVGPEVVAGVVGADPRPLPALVLVSGKLLRDQQCAFTEYEVGGPLPVWRAVVLRGADADGAAGHTGSVLRWSFWR